MRRLEFIGEGSEKFWEGTREGTGVTVSWGRIGTAGQTKVKEFADADAAEAFLTKQVAEKLKKGYADAGTPASTTPPAATEPAPQTESESEWPDEDAFDPLPGVIRLAFPRRDQARPKRRTDPRAAAGVTWFTDQYGGVALRVAEHRDSDADLADAVRRHLDGTPDPVGAAVLATVASMSVSYTHRDDVAYFAHVWLADHGLVFAAEAAMALPTVALNNSGNYSGIDLVRHSTDDEDVPWHWAGQAVLGEIRAAIAAADDDEYAAVVARIGALRTDRKTRLVASFLAPTESAWLDGIVAEQGDGSNLLRWLYLSVVDTPELLADSGGSSYELWYHGRVLPTIVRTVGPGAAPILLDWIDRTDRDVVRRVLAAVAAMPTEAAFRGLLVRADEPLFRSALQEAMQRFPVRATRMLAEALTEDHTGVKWAPAVTELLRTHLMANRLLRTEIVPELAPAPRAVAEDLLSGVVLLAEAPPEALPPVLASPPWTRKRAKVARVVLPDLVVPAEPRIDWAPGEREKAKAKWRGYRWTPYEKADVDWAEEFKNAGRSSWRMPSLLLYAPVELAARQLDWRPVESYGVEDWGPALLDRFGLPAVDLVVATLTKGMGHDALTAVQPVLSTEVAALVADALARLKTARPAARAWLLRHGLATLPYLLPAALGVAGKPRDAAEGALRVLAAHTGTEPLVAEVKRLAGPEAADGVTAVLGTDPLELLPKKLPVPGAWAQPAALPQIRLRDQDLALPAASTADLLTMLALGRPGEPYGGVAQVAQVCDPASLAEFGWQVFDLWRKAGMPPKDGWALTALGGLGDDATVRKLAPVIRAWPGEGGHARAVTGLDVLTEIGTDVALMHLNGIAQKVKFGGLKQRARDRIDLVALNLGLTPDQLADRLVPDLGLSADGTMVLDYGPRRFVVGFDEQLRPFVSDEDGTRRKALPKPGAKDDADVATEAYQRFSGLKKDVRTLAADQITRLERAMVTGRRWSVADFTTYFAEHPLLWHVVRRLVWGVYTESGELTGAFRLAEDRTLADADDDTYVVPEGAVVGVAHPLHLGAALATWAEVFADYEILQPFPQLGRPVLALTEQERASTRLARYENVKVPVGKLLGLTKRGWERTAPQDGGVEPGIVKPLPDGRFVVLTMEEGIVAGAPDMLGDEQTVDGVFLSDDHDGYWYAKHATEKLSTLDPVSASELLADLAEVVAGGAK